MARSFVQLAAIAFVASLTIGTLQVPIVDDPLAAPSQLDAVHPELRAQVAAEGSAVVHPDLAAELDVDSEAIAILLLDPALEEYVVERLEAMGLEHRHWEHLHQAGVRLPASELGALASMAGVLALYPNEVMHPYLSKSASYVGADILWNTYQVRGEGVGIVVVDSGIDGTHPDVEYGANLVENVVPTSQAGGGLIGDYQEGARASDTDGHGTHVAGIVGGTADASSGKYKGVSYRADLIGFKAGITNSDGEVSFESVTVLEAFNYALQNKERFNIRVVTNSWGTGGSFDPLNPINQASFNLYKAGIVVTFAAGNEGSQGEGTLNKYCVAPWVVCVAAGDYLNRRASFSSMGTDPVASAKPYDHPDIMAPGVGIQAAKPVASTDSLLTGATSPESTYYTSKSGTSMATPHVAGAAALLVSVYPDLSPDQVYDLLVSLSTPLDGPVWQMGAGYLNIMASYKEAGDLEGNLDEFLQGNVKYGGRSTGDADYSEDPTTVGLGQGFSKQVGGVDTSPAEFVEELATTPMGITFLVGTLVMAVLAFGSKRKGYVE